MGYYIRFPLEGDRPLSLEEVMAGLRAADPGFALVSWPLPPQTSKRHVSDVVRHPSRHHSQLEARLPATIPRRVIVGLIMAVHELPFWAGFGWSCIKAPVGRIWVICAGVPGERS